MIDSRTKLSLRKSWLDWIQKGSTNSITMCSHLFCNIRLHHSIIHDTLEEFALCPWEYGWRLMKDTEDDQYIKNVMNILKLDCFALSFILSEMAERSGRMEYVCTVIESNTEIIISIIRTGISQHEFFKQMSSDMPEYDMPAFPLIQPQGLWVSHWLQTLRVLQRKEGALINTALLKTLFQSLSQFF